jgi:hypothetical protein
MVREREVSGELARLLHVCNTKREVLFTEAIRRESLAKKLQICAGVGTLLSGLIATAVFVELTSSAIVKLLSAAIAFSSGFISLFVSTYVNNKDVEIMFKGASEFLAIRDTIAFDLLRHGNDLGELLLILEQSNIKYSAISEKYDRYLMKLHSPHRAERAAARPPKTAQTNGRPK